MPIRKSERWFYPIDWPLISQWVRFERAKGRCERCGRPHGAEILQLRDGRWRDDALGVWRDDGGRRAAFPDVLEFAEAQRKTVWLATAHLDHDPQNSKPKNLAALCQRCHLGHDRPEHSRRRRITIAFRRALGDLFEGPYRR